MAVPQAALLALLAAAPAQARPPEEPPAPQVTRLTVAVSGDLLIHSPVWLRARANAGGRGYDFAPMLRPIRRIVRGADLGLCHVETPIGAGAPSGYPLFNAPRALARAIRQTGWDSCDTASNHTLDRGQGGIDATLRALDRHGIRHTGSASSARGARRTTLLRSKGVTIAHLAYTTTTNGLRPPHWWSVNPARPRRILRDVRRARRRGAQAVVVNLHWGTEYRHAPDAVQRALSRRLARVRAITAVVGQHAHVVQPIRRRNGQWIVFGAGNLLSNQTAACCPAATQDGMLALLHLRVGPQGSRVERVRYVPTWVRHPDYAVLPVVAAYRRGRAPAAALRASWRRTTAVVGRRPGLRPAPRRLRR